MPRATNAVARRKRRKKVLDRAKGYYGRKHSSYRFANEQVMRSDAYAYRDRRNRKRDFRRLWITRINAAARQEGMSYSAAHPRPRRGRRRGQPQDARRHRRQRPRRLPPICRASPGGCRGLSRGTHAIFPGRSAKRPPFVFLRAIDYDHHEPTKREAEAGPQAGAQAHARRRGPVRRPRARTCWRPRGPPGAEPVELLTAAGEDLGGDEVEPELLDGSPRSDRAPARSASGGRPGPRGSTRPASTCTASPTRATSARWSAPRRRWSAGRSCVGPGCADPYGPRAVRASMGAVFTQPLVRAEAGATPRAAGGAGRPRRRRRWRRSAAPRPSASGSEREGLPEDVLAACEVAGDDPAAQGAESLNVAAAAAIAMQRISSPAPDRDAWEGDG